MPPNWHSIFVQKSGSHSNDIESEDDNSSVSDSYVDLDISRVEQYTSQALFKTPALRLKLLRSRELDERWPLQELRQTISRTLSPWRSWTGASKDILSVAWGPGDSFAVGASTDHAHERDLPYNKPNNLLFGLLADRQNSLTPLSGHSLERAGSDDLHMTVSHVLFARHHQSLYSASYDRTVKVWDLNTSSGGPPRCRHTLKHAAKVDLLGQMLTSSAGQPQVIATAQHSRVEPVCIYGFDGREQENDDNIRPFTKLVSDRCSRFNIYPSSLQWGPDPQNREYLLVGFAEHDQNDQANREGHIRLWNVLRNSDPIELRSADENVFDVAWVPGRRIIAAATTPRNARQLTHFKATRTVVRFWSFTESNDRVAELECPAADINEIKFHPVNHNLITASCTDGRVYVWDIRKESDLLMILKHGSAIEELDSGRPREEADTGVRFTTWDNDGRFLYTGSSDGRIACWNINVSPTDALVQEIARFDSGIMAGSFNADGSKLLCGTIKGSVEVLSVGASNGQEAELEEENGVVPYVAATERCGTFDAPRQPDELPDDEPGLEGVNAAREYVESGQLEFDKVFGIGQGRNYRGPYNMAARLPGSGTDTSRFFPDVAAAQFNKLIRREGRRRGAVTSQTSWQCRQDALKITQQTRAHRADLPVQPKRVRTVEPEATTSLPERKRSRTSTPFAAPFPAHEVIDVDAYVPRSSQTGQAGTAVGTPPPVERLVVITPRRSSSSGFVVPPGLPNTDAGAEPALQSAHFRQ